MSAQKFYKTPFATAGDVTAIPEPAQGDGAMSYAEGFGFDYERDPGSDPAAKRISRSEFNQLIRDITDNLRQYQLAGAPEYVTAAQNGGVAVAYTKNAQVRYDLAGDGTDWRIFRSKVNNNTALPTDVTKWTQADAISAASLLAPQANVNEGDDDGGLVGPIELNKAAREGRWTFAGAAAYATTHDLTVAFGGDATSAPALVAGATVAFTVPTANTVATLTLKLGALAAKALRTAIGNELDVGDLQPNTVYAAQYSGAEWRMTTPITSELRQFGSDASDGPPLGLYIANAAGALTTAISISAGGARDSTNAQAIILAAPLTKRLDAAFAAGSGNGGRDTGAVAANQTWHIFVILNPVTGAVDGLLSQSANAPVLPAGFTFFRRVGSVLTDGAGNIRQFTQTGEYFMLHPRSADYAAQANGGGPFLRKITVPNGVSVRAICYFQSTGTVDANVYLSGLYSPLDGIPTAFGGPTQWAQIRRLTVWNYPGVWNSYGTVVCEVFTDTAQNIYTYSSDPGDLIAVGVLGWRDDRRRNA